MTVETRPYSGQLALRTNGSSNLTERGRAIRELVLKYSMLNNHKNPNVEFAISQEFLIQYSNTVDELCSQLGLPKEGKARENSIKGYKGKLIQMGHPHWRMPQSKFFT